jgi:hypothetical protein
MKTIVVHIPKRCKNPRLEVFDDHIDKVNNARSKKYLPEDTNIIEMGMGGDKLIALYEEKHFGKKRVTPPKKVVKKVVRKKQSVNKSELKRAINKQKKFLRGEVNKSFW